MTQERCHSGAARPTRTSLITGRSTATCYRPKRTHFLRRRSSRPSAHRPYRARSEGLFRPFHAETIGDSAAIQYFTTVESDTMRPLDELTGSIRLLASIKLGSVRLLDNIGVELAP